MVALLVGWKVAMMAGPMAEKLAVDWVASMDTKMVDQMAAYLDELMVGYLAVYLVDHLVDL